MRIISKSLTTAISAGCCLEMIEMETLVMEMQDVLDEGPEMK